MKVAIDSPQYELYLSYLDYPQINRNHLPITCASELHYLVGLPPAAFGCPAVPQT